MTTTFKLKDLTGLEPFGALGEIHGFIDSRATLGEGLTPGEVMEVKEALDRWATARFGYTPNDVLKRKLS